MGTKALNIFFPLQKERGAAYQKIHLEHQSNHEKT